MPNFNRVLLMGNLTREPELKYTPNQTAVVEFGIAVNHRWKSKEGEQKEEVCFIDCVSYGHVANAVNN